MLTERGFADIVSLVIFLIVMGLLAGGVALVATVPCDQKVQHCIDYGSGTVEAPK